MDETLSPGDVDANRTAAGLPASDRLDRLLAEFLQQRDAGAGLAAELLVAVHPEFAAELREYFAADEQLEKTLCVGEATLINRPAAVPPPDMPIDQMVTLIPSATQPPPASRGARIGQRFGDYEILSEIAKGGMGVVYKARQTKLNRLVAIKMILSGQFANQDEVDRFYAEAKAAANLRHDNVVGIHEVGECGGQHFFSMEYIDGKSLSDLVRRDPLIPREAARIVKIIAETMHYAHGKGILHRDLKPSNILMDKSKPLITDFGLAKQVESGSQLTVSGAIVGTPSYMPPEQAQGRLAEVGRTSDVYSTGAILYELVTGSPPFRAANPFETIRQVIEQEPISPRQRNTAVPADIATICLRCLEKEPLRRYQTEQELADELGRFLNGEPILARPIGRVEQVTRWCKKNPVVASLAGLLVVAILAAWLGTSIGFVQAKRSEARAKLALTQALKSVDRLSTVVSQDVLLNEPGAQSLRKKLLSNARDLYQELLSQQGNDPTVRGELALSYFRLGRILDDVASASDAVEPLQKALAMQQGLVKENPQRPEYAAALGDTLNALGTVTQKQKQFDDARRYYLRAIDVRSRLADRNGGGEHQRTLANSYMNLGQLRKFQGELEAAGKDLETAQELRRQMVDHGHATPQLQRDLGMGAYNLALLADMRGDATALGEQLELAADIFRQLVEQKPTELSLLDNQNRLAVCYRLLGDLAQQANDLETARGQYGKARDQMEPLAEKNPDVLEFKMQLAGLLLNLGLLERNLQRPEAALAAFGRACDILKELVQRDPEMTVYRRDWAVALRELAAEEAAVGRAAESIQHRQESDAQWAVLGESPPAPPETTPQSQEHPQ